MLGTGWAMSNDEKHDSLQADESTKPDNVDGEAPTLSPQSTTADGSSIVYDHPEQANRSGTSRHAKRI